MFFYTPIMQGLLTYTVLSIYVFSESQLNSWSEYEYPLYVDQKQFRFEAQSPYYFYYF